MLRLLSSKAQGRKDPWKLPKPCHVGIHWEALTEFSHEYPYARVSIIFPVFLPHFVLAKLAISSIRLRRFSVSSSDKGQIPQTCTNNRTCYIQRVIQMCTLNGNVFLFEVSYIVLFLSFCGNFMVHISLKRAPLVLWRSSSPFCTWYISLL